MLLSAHLQLLSSDADISQLNTVHVRHCCTQSCICLWNFATLLIVVLCMQASVMSIWTKDQSKKAEARAMAAALAAANAAACQGVYHPPHPSILKESLHESFRGWNAQNQ